MDWSYFLDRLFVHFVLACWQCVLCDLLLDCDHGWCVNEAR